MHTSNRKKGGNILKNKTKKIIKIICAVMIVIAIQAIGTTYAKYITVEKGTGSTEVAKWAFEIKKGSAETKKIQLTNTVDKDSLIDGKISPGSTGLIEITLDGTGAEVDIDYELKFSNEQNKPSNLIFTYQGVEYKSLSEINTIQGNIPHDDTYRTRDVNIQWRWEYETGKTEKEITTNDVLDTQEANSITAYTFELTATGTQSE